MTRGEVERIVAPYVKRIEALEKEVAELRARPSGEQHTHYHYPAPVPVLPLPQEPFGDFPAPPVVICDAGTAA